MWEGGGMHVSVSVYVWKGVIAQRCVCVRECERV